LTNLGSWNTSRKKLDEVSSVEDRCGVIRLPSSLDRHAALHEIQCASDPIPL
jgi:hypothetical protein